MDYRLSERMMVSACAAGILIVMLGNRRQSLTMSAVGAGLMVLGLLQALIFYKCPHCKKRFKIGSRRPSVCPYCGAKGFFQCAECGRTTCWNGETETVCEWCGNEAETAAEEKFDSITGGGF